MKKRLGILVLALIIGLLCPATAKAQEAPALKGAKETPSTICNDNEWGVLKIVNKERMANGLQPISTFRKIQSACDVRATEVTKYFSHTRPNGKSCFSILSEKNINYYSAGENIAAGYWSPESVMNGWMNSPGHRANILTSYFNHIGVGYTTGGGYGNGWVQLFVGGCRPTSISVAGPVSEVKSGISIDNMNLYLEIKCSDPSHGTSYCPISAKMCSGYSPSKTTGQTVTVKYQGMTTTFNIGKVKAPDRVKNLKLSKAGITSAKLTWSKVVCDGYEVYGKETSKGQYKLLGTFSSKAKAPYAIKKLKPNVKYFVKVRAYKKQGTKKIYGKWCSSISFRTKAK